MIGMSKKTHTSIVITDTVKLEGYTFQVTEIGNNAFKDSTKLKTVKIGNKLKKIRTKAFANCKKLKKITVGKGLVSIGKQAFSNCRALRTIEVNSSTVKMVDRNAFKGISSKASIKVPKKRVSKYKQIFKKDGRGKKVKIK